MISGSPPRSVRYHPRRDQSKPSHRAARPARLLISRQFGLRTLFSLAVVCSAIASLTISTASAFASRKYLSQITGFSDPWGIAVDSTDHVWISDPGNGGDIFKYSPYPSEALELTQTGDGVYPAKYIRSLAVDSANGYLYVADEGEGIFAGRIDVFDPINFVPPQWTIREPTIAIDNSGGPSNGRVYVASYEGGGVYAFEPDGTPVSFSATEPYISKNTIELAQAHGLTVDNEGNLFVINYSTNAVDEYHASGEFVQEFTGAGGPGEPTFSNLQGVAVDPLSGNVLIADRGADVIDEFSESGEFLESFSGPSAGESFGRINGIAVNSKGDVYVTDGGDQVVDIFGPTPSLPKIDGESVTDVTQTSGVANATVNPNGAGKVIGCYLEYGLTKSYGSPHVPCSPAAPYESITKVQAAMAALTPDKTYHYRIVLTDAAGESKRGPDQTFTPHAVTGITTEAAAAIAPTSATLHGSFVGNGEDTHYYFQWGVSTAYGNETPVEDAGSPAGPNSTGLSYGLAGLQPQTTYNYRVVGNNAVGTSYGQNETFTTPPAVSGVITDPPSAIGATDATLSGSFIGNGEETHYFFQWGSSSSYGNVTTTEDAGSPGGPTPSMISFGLSNLNPVTTYHYRLVAINRYGSSEGEDQSFTTPPAAPLITEEASSGVQSDLARLGANINPGGGVTRYHFEYGTEACSAPAESCTDAPVPSVELGAATTYQHISLGINDLMPNTVYHWRLVARNKTGTTDGPDHTFTTYALASFSDSCPNSHVRQQTGAAQLLDCRAYELVSAANTGGYDVESNLVAGQTPFGSLPRSAESLRRTPGPLRRARWRYPRHRGSHQPRRRPLRGHPRSRRLEHQIRRHPRQ